MSLKIIWQYLLPQHLLSRLVGVLAHCRITWLKNAFIKLFINYFHVDMSTAQEPNPLHYENFNAFFTRALKPGVRPIVTGDNTIACPVDGFVSQIGDIKNGQLFQAKGHTFSLSALLGSESANDLFHNGQFATLYLAPQNYHRIHMPITGHLKKMTYIPGKLFSVGRTSVAHIPQLFARNERVVTFFDTEIGPIALILVGAMIVGSIETVWEGLITPNPSTQIQHYQYTQDVILQKGEEMGRFQLGSTIILLTAHSSLQWAKRLQPEMAVMLGELLGTY